MSLTFAQGFDHNYDTLWVVSWDVLYQIYVETFSPFHSEMDTGKMKEVIWIFLVIICYSKEIIGNIILTFVRTDEWIIALGNIFF